MSLGEDRKVEDMTRMMTRTAAAAFAVSAVTLGLTGCSSDDGNAALDAYVDAERDRVAESNDTETETSIEPDYPSGVVITYSYLEPIDLPSDPSELDELLGGLAPGFEQECADNIFPAMREAGVEGELSATFGYANDGESAFWSYTCESS